MPGLYVDTSALGRVALGEADAPAVRASLAKFDPWYASELLLVELGRLGRRAGIESTAERLLTLVTLVPLSRGGLERAAQVDPTEVRSLDAIHLAAAIDLQASGEIAAVLTYDSQLQVGCRHHGILVEAPTA